MINNHNYDQDRDIIPICGPVPSPTPTPTNITDWVEGYKVGGKVGIRYGIAIGFLWGAGSILLGISVYVIIEIIKQRW